jgi:hypothetical protein
MKIRLKIFLVILFSISGCWNYSYYAVSATFHTDYGKIIKPTVKYNGREFLSLMNTGSVVLGSGAEVEKNMAFTDNSSMTFLPGSFFFRLEEFGLESVHQMLYPAIRDLSDSRNILIPVTEFGIALSGNKFDFTKSGNTYTFTRLPGYKKRLMLASVADTDKPLGITGEKSSNPDNITSTKDSKLSNPVFSKKLYKQGKEKGYLYNRLRPLPESREQSESYTGIEYNLPEKVRSKIKPSPNSIPVYENGVMMYIESDNKPSNSSPKSNNSELPLLRMGSDKGDTIQPPSINYELPGDLKREEIERNLRKD